MDDIPQLRKVELEYGVKIECFWSPPGKVQRWRVRFPKWIPEGTWLHSEHSFPSFSDALTALNETETLMAVEELWKARSAESAARQKFFSKAMAAHARRDKSYPPRR